MISQSANILPSWTDVLRFYLCHKHGRSVRVLVRVLVRHRYDWDFLESRWIFALVVILGHSHGGESIPLGCLSRCINWRSLDKKSLPVRFGCCHWFFFLVGFVFFYFIFYSVRHSDSGISRATKLLRPQSLGLWQLLHYSIKCTIFMGIHTCFMWRSGT